MLEAKGHVPCVPKCRSRKIQVKKQITPRGALNTNNYPTDYPMGPTSYPTGPQNKTRRGPTKGRIRNPLRPIPRKIPIPKTRRGPNTTRITQRNPTITPQRPFQSSADYLMKHQNYPTGPQKPPRGPTLRPSKPLFVFITLQSPHETSAVLPSICFIGGTPRLFVSAMAGGPALPCPLHKGVSVIYVY